MSVTIKDYQDWLKNNKSVKVAKEGEKLSTFDEQKNRALYEQYVKEAQLYNDKQAKETQLDQDKQEALRDNYIAQAQAQKGANDAVKAARMTTGLSESSLVDLYSQGAQARANIIKESDAKKAELLSLYKQGVADAKINANSKVAEIEASRSGDATLVYNQAIEDYYNGMIDESTLDGIVEKYKNDLSEYDFNKFSSTKKAVKTANAPYEVAEAIENFKNDMIDFEELQRIYDSYSSYLSSNDKELIDIYKQFLTEYESAKKIKNTALDKKSQLLEDRNIIAAINAQNKMENVEDGAWVEYKKSGRGAGALIENALANTFK